MSSAFNFNPLSGTNLFQQYPNYLEFANYVQGQMGGATQWNWQLFDTLYRTSWVAEKCVTVIADDMTEKWREFQHPDPEVVKIRQKYEDENEISTTVHQAIMASRLYGGAALIPIIKSQYDESAFKEPFNPESVRKDDLAGFQVLTKFDLNPLSGINRDIFQSPKLYGDYIYYQIIRIQTMMDAATTTQEPVNSSSLPTIHASRMIKFYGKELMYYQKFFSGGWGDSILVTLIDKIPAIEEAFHLIFLYLDLFNVDEIKIQNLSSIVNSNGGAQLFSKYKQFRDRMRNSKLRFMDANDEMNRNQLSSLQNIVPVFQSLIQFVVGATGIPITRILGTSVSGWSSTGDNELTQYYDLVAQNQKKLAYQLRCMDEIIERSLFGKKMDIKYRWLPKREMTEKERAEIQKTKADTFAIYMQNRVMTPKVVAENIKDEYEAMDNNFILSLDEDFLDDEYEEEEFGFGKSEEKEEEKAPDSSPEV